MANVVGLCSDLVDSAVAACALRLQVVFLDLLSSIFIVCMYTCPWALLPHCASCATRLRGILSVV
jgi:hypothetical protein